VAIQDDRTVVVKQISTINFSGNIIPNSWFQEIKLPGGSPDTTAILILSEIIYWYRGYEVKDEDSGETIGHKKKFRADMLQRSYESFSTQFGFKKSTIQAAFKNLRSLGLVRTELRTIIIGSGLRCNNVLFIEPIPKAVLNITITRGGPQEKVGEAPQEKLGEVPKENLGTNTESTTEITKKNIQAYSDTFMQFWKSYPTGSRGKAGKGKAFQAWQRLRCDSILDKVLASLESWKKADQWRKDDGEFIPDPQTWLNRHGWEDELPVYRKQVNPPRIPRNPLEMTDAEKRVYARFENMQTGGLLPKGGDV